ncbi:MAG: hypothetical protein FOGNACKC_02275 [Anaerolineae bacterium]|nr:hypothetical protein [Anaerolineae bacterium]
MKQRESVVSELRQRHTEELAAMRRMYESWLAEWQDICDTYANLMTEQDELIAQLQGALDTLIPAAEAAMLRQYGLIPDDNLVVDLAIALERAKASRQ